ncbi:unnamed protein product [Urochloa decumbens]|uniref:Transmembrane protein n=1 Tax=Urochloa decumbens TaxID=240449 RepID=A0ABC8Z0M3_9POAL
MAAEKIKMRRQLAAPLLPAVRVATKQQQARTFPPLPAVQLVSQWGLFNAVVFGGTFAFGFALFIINPCIPSWMLLLLGIDLTPDAAEDAKATAMAIVAFLCTVTLAAAATPALLLAAHHRQIRRALAYVVLAAAVAIHCIYVSVLDLYHVEYHVLIRIILSAVIFVFAAGDLLCFLALLVGTDE